MFLLRLERKKKDSRGIINNSVVGFFTITWGMVEFAESQATPKSQEKKKGVFPALKGAL